jgi:hypothetical protein
LLDWKEGFGGRTCAHDFYDIPTANHAKLGPVLSRQREADNPAPQKQSAPAN